MTAWDIIIPILTLLLGLVGGFYGGTWYFKREAGNMQMDEKQLQQLGRSMGVNLNQKQLNQMTRKMGNVNLKKKKKKK